MKLCVLSLLLLGSPAFAAPAKASASRKPAPAAKPAPAPVKPPEDKPVNVTAKSLEVAPDARQAVWQDDVVAERDDFRLTCDRLIAEYDPSRRLKQLVCSGNVHLTQKAAPGEPVREGWGEQAVFETATNSVTITGSPRAREGENAMNGSKVTFLVRENRLQVERPELTAEEAGKRMKVSARALDIPRDSNQAVWKGEVVAERDDFRLSCNRLTAEYAESAKLRRLVCNGDVHLQQKKPAGSPPREGWGDKAVFDNALSTVVLTGNPRAREGDSSMKGSKVTYLIDQKKLRVDNPVMLLDTQQAKGGVR
ncbi:MAG: lipopolysaccharide transport periplasmic protein LptA [Myxococcales bacterium]